MEVFEKIKGRMRGDGEFLRRRSMNASRASSWVQSLSVDTVSPGIETNRNYPVRIILPVLLHEPIKEIIRKTAKAAGDREFYTFIGWRRIDRGSGEIRIKTSDVKGVSGMGIALVGLHSEAWSDDTFGSIHSHPSECPPSVVDIAGLNSLRADGVMFVVTKRGTIYLISVTQSTKFEERVKVDPAKLELSPILSRLLKRVFGIPRAMHEYISFLMLWSIPHQIEIDILKGLRVLGINKPGWIESLIARQTMAILSFCENYQLLLYKGSTEDFMLDRIVP